MWLPVQIKRVVIPVEQGFSTLVEFAEKSMFHFVQHVEPDKDIAFIGQLADVQMFQDMTVQHAFVGQILFFQAFFETGIDRAKRIPKVGKSGFEFSSLFHGEIPEKLAERFFLSLFQKCLVVGHTVQVAQITEKFIGVDQIFVGIIKVTDEQFAPEIEVIKGFFASGHVSEYFVEFADQFHRIAGLHG